MAAESEWVSISEYARVHTVSRNTVYKWIEEQLLETYQVGAIVRVKNVPPKKPDGSAPVQGC